MSPALADYRLRKEHVKHGEEYGKPAPRVTAVLKRWVILRGSLPTDDRLDKVLEHGGRWHLQIGWKGKPKYCARAFYGRPAPDKPDEKAGWAIEWFSGYRLASSVDRGLAWLEENESRLDLKGEVRFVSTRLYKFSSLWLASTNEHLIVSAFDSADQIGGAFLPLLELMSQAELCHLLRRHFPRGAGRVTTR